jgi:hypothetical protein
MTTKLFRSSRIAVFAGLLLCIPAANAALIQIPAPNAAYTSATTLIPITGADGDTTTALSDAVLTVTFDTLMQKFSVPVTWGSWNSPPATEGSTPNVLSPFDFSITTITLSFSQPLSVFGLEAEPDATTQGAFPVSMVFFNGVTQLGTLNNTIDGFSAALFAASSTTPITSVVLSIGGTLNDPAGTDPGIAQVRYALAAPAGVPEPATWSMMSAAVLGLLMVRRFRYARN